MDLTSVRLARAIWLLDVDELNPQGRSLLPAAEALRQRYEFVKSPSVEQMADPKDGLTFQFGRFRPEGIDADLHVDFQVFSDGLIADTRADTRYSELFLQEVAVLFVEHLGGDGSAVNRVKRAFRSEVTVFAPELNLTAACLKFTQIAHLVSAARGHGTPVQATGLYFGTDAKSGGKDFVFERRSNADLDAHKYFSSAALPTQDHVELLKDFEHILIGG